MYAKIRITCTLRVVTGLHIGNSNGFAAIGALDNPVVRDAFTGQPYIPGTSLKGKMRTLLARSRSDGSGPLNSCEKDAEPICRLFGTPGKDSVGVRAARLQFSDAFVSNAEEMIRRGGLTEIKKENTINRATSVAKPRDMERIVRGAEFRVVWYYTLENGAELLEDMQTLAEGCKLLNLDYLGGSGTRGYGRVCLKDFSVQCMLGKLPEGVGIGDIKDCFKDVSDIGAEDL
ncbi:MAG: type III-A CRISPR-associated RAMP protein Csm3 [Clostridia bacterium]|nr:type III-A CRISPR-associated RAMP protein Csm3 [Clostridia bacterium]